MLRCTISFFALLFAVPALAKGSIPPRSFTVDLIKGKVSLVRAGKNQGIEKGTTIKLKDRIQTEKDGFIRLRATDATLDIAPFSILSLEQSSNGSLFFLRYGHLSAQLSKTKNKRTKKRFSIKTPSATMGIRGTEVLLHAVVNEEEYVQRLSGNLNPPPSLSKLEKLGQSKEFFSQFCCVSGEIEVNLEGTKKPIFAKPGEIIQFEGKQSEEGAEHIGVQAILKTKKQLGFQF